MQQFRVCAGDGADEINEFPTTSGRGGGRERDEKPSKSRSRTSGTPWKGGTRAELGSEREVPWEYAGAGSLLAAAALHLKVRGAFFFPTFLDCLAFMLYRVPPL